MPNGGLSEKSDYITATITINCIIDQIQADISGNLEEYESEL